MSKYYDQEKKEYDNTEEKLSELHNNIHHMERKIRMTDSEKKADVEDSTMEIKKNDLEIKRLMMEVKELEVRIKRCQKADENVILNELNKYNRHLGRMKGKSGREAVDLLDADILELDKKRKSIDHELQILKRTLQSNEQQLKEMTTKCIEDFENEPTEYDSLQRIRELENEQQKINKNVLECELAQSKFKMMKEQLQTNQLSYPILLMNVEREFQAQQLDTDIGEMEQVSSETSDDIGAGDNNSRENNKDKRKKVTFLNEHESTNTTVSEQQKELHEIQEAFEKIKEVTGVSDIQDAEGRFLVQKSINDDLHDLRKRLVKSLHELKMEKKQLDSKMALICGSGTEGPKRELSEELILAKRRLEEQEKRKKDAKLELDKITSLLTEVDTQQRKILKLLEPSLEKVSSTQELTASEVSKKLEDTLVNTLK